MRHTAARLALAAALLALGAPPPRAADGAAPATPTGPARFTSHPRFVAAKLSPKGTWLAVVSVEGGKRSLSFIRLADRRVAGRVSPTSTTMVGNFAWANDERVVIDLWRQAGTLARPYSFGELLTVNPEGAVIEPLFGTSDLRRYHPNAEEERASARLVDTLRHDDRHVLVSVTQHDGVGDRRVRLVKLDVYNGSKTEEGESPMPNSTYLTDEEGEPRIAWSLGEEARYKILFRDGPRGWRPVDSLPGLTRQSLPWHFRASSRTLEVVEPLDGGFGIFSIGIDDGARTLLASTELAPPNLVLRDQTGRILGIESEPDLPAWQFLDEGSRLVQVLTGLLDAHPGLHVDFLSRTDDQRKAIAYVYGDRDPGRFLLVDVEKRTAEQILEVRPWIVPDEMAEMTAFHVKASDGDLIHGYVTYPRGLPAGTKPPLVVLPHGGPFGVRDTWGFNPEVQLLANEGFAVLQVNYRGSGGYGEAYREAGYLHWGDRMIEDILDATRWLVRKGKVDASRMCTYGASFGGYAALQSTILAPDLFRCAVGFAGVYDLTRLEHNDDIVTSGRARGYVRTTTGADEALLQAASPAFHADQIKVPVLLIHGRKDTRVPIVHAEMLRDALTGLGRPPGWMEEPKEGHGFYDEAARERMYAALIAFLKLHTAPKVESPGAGATAPVTAPRADAPGAGVAAPSPAP